MLRLKSEGRTEVEVHEFGLCSVPHMLFWTSHVRVKA